MSKIKTQQKWSLTSVDLRDAYTDFILSRQAMNAAPATLEFYKYTVGKFLEWVEERGITTPDEITARYVREYIAELVSRGEGRHNRLEQCPGNQDHVPVLAEGGLPGCAGQVRLAEIIQKAPAHAHGRAGADSRQSLQRKG